jgi:hypothetical protein
MHGQKDIKICFKLLAQHFCVNTEENDEKCQNVWPLDLQYSSGSFCFKVLNRMF